MAPHKCNYQVFNKSKENGEVLMRLYGKIIPKDNTNELKYLGMTFDSKMTLAEQVRQVQITCESRSNILKVLSHRHWKVPIKAAINMYISLVRSIIDYTLFAYDIMPKKEQNKLQILQNNCLRIVLKKQKDEISIINLHKEAEIETIAERARSLKKSYELSCTKNENPLYKQLIDEFNEFKMENVYVTTPTLLDALFLETCLETDQEIMQMENATINSTITEIAECSKSIISCPESDESTSSKSLEK